MLKDYLDVETYKLITKNFSFKDITEIRMRINQRLIIVVKNKKYFLKDEAGEYVVTNALTIENFVRKISANSLYAFNDEIIKGYITLPHGVRVGLCGTLVTDNGKIITMKDFQSINIRIPHFVKNCSLPVYDLLVNDGIKNTLIISGPGSGKTTFIRDFVYQLEQHGVSQNVLIADERNEICAVNNSEPGIDLGAFADIITNSSKKFAFTNAIRSMRPDVIVTDEIDLNNDLDCIVEAMNSGVNMIATIHAKDLNQLRRKAGFEKVIQEKYFSRFIVLSSDEGPGTINYVYDEKLNCLYCR
ncbi:MAG: Flp pilus assembly complex ATPase component TadA [Clostridia bacterium]|nr:Flp pilus assembly complex ATPase component TadA [Clostridia bacterium]